MITLVALVLAYFLLPSPWNLVVVVGAATVDLVEAGTFVWWSQRRKSSVGVHTFVGRRARTVTPLCPGGQVRLDGEIWEARSSAALDPECDVVVRGIDGLVLDVEPLHPLST